MYVPPLLVQRVSEPLHEDLTVALRAKLLNEPAHEVGGEADIVSADESFNRLAYGHQVVGVGEATTKKGLKLEANGALVTHNPLLRDLQLAPAEKCRRIR